MSSYDSSICDSSIPYRPRQLRKLKIVTYLENMDDEPSPNGTLILNRPKKNKHKRSEDVDSSLSTSMNDDSLFSKASVHRKPVLGKTLSRRTNLPHSDDSQESDDSSSSICSLERRRLKNIQENKEFLKSLGITQIVEEISNRLEEKKYAEKKKRANRAKRPKVEVKATALAVTNKIMKNYVQEVGTTEIVVSDDDLQALGGVKLLKTMRYTSSEHWHGESTERLGDS
uniref:Uncharacterized protein n=1 Tax=Timema tahoe TaxID=61484 RepID=A0A7R9FLL8_9NEOP|nr:unnamed protein product [Timema tahoe]